MENHYFGCKLGSEIKYKIREMQFTISNCTVIYIWNGISRVVFIFPEMKVTNFVIIMKNFLVQFSIYLKKQQTPNPEAQFPDAMPPLLEHSSAVKQTPYIVVVVSMFVWHCMLSNDTTENREKAPVLKQIVSKKFTNKL